MSYYDQEDGRPDDDWDEEKIEHFYQLWLLDKAMEERAEEHAADQAAMMLLKVLPKVAHADPDTW